MGLSSLISTESTHLVMFIIYLVMRAAHYRSSCSGSHLNKSLDGQEPGGGSQEHLQHAPGGLQPASLLASTDIDVEPAFGTRNN